MAFLRADEACVLTVRADVDRLQRLRRQPVGRKKGAALLLKGLQTAFEPVPAGRRVFYRRAYQSGLTGCNIGLQSRQFRDILLNLLHARFILLAAPGLPGCIHAHDGIILSVHKRHKASSGYWLMSCFSSSLKS